MLIAPDLQRVFRDARLRCTRQRQAVYAALASTCSHPSAEELFDHVRVEEPGLSLATVYNTLDALCDAGLCRRLPMPGGANRYDADSRPHAHLALADGRLVDLPEDLSRVLLDRLTPEFVREVAARTGTDVRRLSVHLMECSARGPSDNPSARQVR